MSDAIKASFGEAPAGYCVLVHGGAGGRAEGELEPERESCTRAAQAAGEVLRSGGSALDAVQRAVELLEDDPQLNAGTGGALTDRGTLELDAAIMEGSGLRAGAVCCLPPYRHPIAIARAVLEQGRHVLYAADGADAFARAAGFTPEDPARMITERARAQLQRFLATQGVSTGGNTVGAVARDRAGHVAAATSTGGVVGKRPGRVGDTPIPGGGTYADDSAGAVSATGRGEGILRVALAARVALAMGNGDVPEAAVRKALSILAARVGTEAGLIAVAPDGRIGLARTSASMPWAAVREGMLLLSGH